MAAIEIGDVAAIRSNLCDNFLELAVGVGDVVRDEDDAEVGSYGEGPGEQVEDHFGVGAGGDVVILGRKAEEDIADTAAGEVGLIAGCAQLENDALGGELCWRVGHCDSLKSWRPVSSWRPGFRVAVFEPRWDSDDRGCLLG